MSQDCFAIIVGQGLAGSLLAWELEQRGLPVLVVDDQRRLSSSAVAAGLINPLLGKRLRLDPATPTLLAAARRSYRLLQRQFGEPLWQPLPMLRLMRDPSQWRQLKQRQVNPLYQPYLGHAIAPGDAVGGYANPQGAVWQEQAGRLNLPRLLYRIGHWLRETGKLQQTEMSFRELRSHARGLAWRDWRAQRLICCEGQRAVCNPWFRNLPMQLAQGDILRIRMDPLQSPTQPMIVNWGHWLVRESENSHLLGASNRWQIDQLPSPSDRQQLLLSLAQQKTHHGNVLALRHLTGVRPASKDGNPLLGPHPEDRRICIFNGFGAKGSLSIPWYAQRMADWLAQDAPLPAEAAIDRFRQP